jgi:hypothetical protein
MTQTATKPVTSPSSSPRTGLQIAAIIAGGLASLAGIGLAAIGALLLGVFGSDGTVASGSQSLSTSRTALVSSVADINDVSDVADVVGDPSVRFSAAASGAEGDVFVGIGPADQVDRYLAAAPIDEVTDFEIDPFELTRRPHAGTTRPEPPSSQTLWVAKATGRNTATLDWKVRDGDYRLVLMNADGSRPVDADGEVKLTLPHVAGIAWALTGGGLLLLLGGITAVVLAARRRTSSTAPATA